MICGGLPLVAGPAQTLLNCQTFAVAANNVSEKIPNSILDIQDSRVCSTIYTRVVLVREIQGYNWLKFLCFQSPSD